jgi:hypothetical protein
VGTDQAWIGELAAGVVAQHNRWSVRVRQVLVPPPHEDDDRSEEIAACLGEPVLVALGIPGIWHAIKQAHIDKHPQPRRERGPRNAEVTSELTEALHPEECLAQDQQRPALTDQLECPTDRLRFEAVG